MALNATEYKENKNIPNMLRKMIHIYIILIKFLEILI
jgi:hypothetical protein